MKDKIQVDVKITAQNKYMNMQKTSDCEACNALNEIAKLFSEYSNKTYYHLTELFVELHDGKDYCER